MVFVPLFHAQIYNIYFFKQYVTGTHFVYFWYIILFHNAMSPEQHPNLWRCDRYTEKWLLSHCSMPKFILSLKKKKHVTGTHFFLFLTYYDFLHCNVPNIVSNHWGCDRYTEKWLLFHCSMPKFILYLKKTTCHGDTFLLIFDI